MTNPLTLIPAKYRQAVYALLALFALGYAVWQASDGDWKTFAVGLLLALSHTTAASNTKPRPPKPVARPRAVTMKPLA